MTLQQWRQLALGGPRAWGEPQATGVLRAVPEDFVVEEDLGFAPDGDGAHLLLKVRKRNANTGWVAQELARGLGCPVRDIGFAGLKDRRAVAIQWFSLPATPRSVSGAAGFANPEFAVLEVHRHRRKLPRLAGSGGVAAGPQRPGCPDGFVLSAARSLVFNAVVGERVRDGSWDTLRIGDVANLDARGSVFAVAELTPDLPQRLAQLDVHPTGPMWGAGELMSRGPVLELEQRIGLDLARACQCVIDAGLRQERRSLRLKVRDLRWESQPDGVVLRFWLRSGSFATAVLRELLTEQCAGGQSLEVDADDA